eukprot:3717807-Pleurochrysis_carterae.AAC.1
MPAASKAARRRVNFRFRTVGEAQGLRERASTCMPPLILVVRPPLDRCSRRRVRLKRAPKKRIHRARLLLTRLRVSLTRRPIQTTCGVRRGRSKRLR